MSGAISGGARPASRAVPDVAALIRATAPCCVAPLSTSSRKNIPLYRNSVLAYVSAIPAHQEGRSCGRHVREPGLRWTRQRRHEMGRAGRVVPVSSNPACGRAALPGFVSPCKFPASSTGLEILRRHGGPCVRQNRVVLAVVATVKPFEDAREPNRADGIVNSNGEGGQKESSAPGRARHKPSDHRAGKAE
jgi:hypothetical protein